MIFSAISSIVAGLHIHNQMWEQWSKQYWVSMAMGSVHSGFILVLAGVLLVNFASLVFVAVWWALNARNAEFPHRFAASLTAVLLLSAASYIPSNQHYATGAVLLYGPGPRDIELQRDAARYDSKMLLNALVYRGAAIEKTLLCFAAYNDSPTVMSRLIELGFQVNDQHYPSKITALHNAVEGAQYRSARLLISAGARTDIPNMKGVTPFALALSKKDERMLALLKQ